MTYKHQVSFIGTGAVGATLATVLHGKGVFISGLYNRTKSKADRLGARTDAETTGVFPNSLEFLGDICFLCVPDDTISEIADKLAGLKGTFSNVHFVHTSGSKPAAALERLSERGAEIASFHPLQTFDGPTNYNIFRNSYISIQGDDEPVKTLQELAELLEAKPLLVSEKQKANLHLAAVIASNYLVALMEASRQSLNLEMPNVDVAEIFQPLISKTMDNIIQKGIDPSLTGPIARGDAGTVKDHLKMLTQLHGVSEVYTSLGHIALTISERNGLAQDKIEVLQNILNDGKSEQSK